MRRVIKLFEGETADKTSGAINILGAKKVVLFCKRANHTAGSTTFSAVVGVEGNETAYNKWISNVSTETRVSSLVLNTNGCGFLTMDPKDTFETIKVTADVTTDGANSAWLILDY